MSKYTNELFTAFSGKVDASFTKSVQQVSQSLTQLSGKASGIQKTVTATGNLNKQMKSGSIAAAKYGVGLGSVGSALSQITRYAIAGSILGGITAAFAKGFTTIVEYDQSLKNLQAITGGTSSQIDSLGNKIVEVSNATKFSATEVAEAAVLLGQAGFSATETLQSIDAVASVATGTLTDFATVADLMTTTIRAFKLAASDAGDVADVLAISVNQSKLTIDKLRTAFNFVGASSAQAGLSLRETASSLQILANNGLRASTMATGFRNVLSKILAPTTKIRAALSRLDISVNDINPSIVGFQTAMKNIIPILVNSETGMIDAGKASEFFGLRGQQAATILARAFTGNDFEKVLENTNRLGEAFKQQLKQQEGLGIKLKNLADRWKNVAVALGESGATRIIEDAIEALSGLAIAIQKVINSYIKAEDTFNITNGSVKTLDNTIKDSAEKWESMGSGLDKYINVLSRVDEYQNNFAEGQRELLKLVDILDATYGDKLGQTIDKYRSAIENAPDASSLSESARGLQDVLNVFKDQSSVKAIQEYNKGIATAKAQLNGFVKAAAQKRKELSDVKKELTGSPRDESLLLQQERLTRELDVLLPQQITKAYDLINKFQVKIDSLLKPSTGSEKESSILPIDDINIFESKLNELGPSFISTFEKLKQEGNVFNLDTFISGVNEASDEWDKLQVTLQQSGVIGDAKSKSYIEAYAQFVKNKLKEINKDIYGGKDSNKLFKQRSKALKSALDTDLQNIEKNKAQEQQVLVKSNALKIDILNSEDKYLDQRYDKNKKYYDDLIKLIQENKEQLGDKFASTLAETESEREAARLKILEDSAELEQKIFEERMTNPQNFKDAWESALRSLQQKTKTSFTQIKDFIIDAVDTIADSSADAFLDFVEGTESAAEAFSDMAYSIIRDLAKMIIKQQIYNALVAGASSLSTSSGSILSTIGSAITGAISSNHSGGMAGKASSIKKNIDPTNFINAPKFHSGGEVNAVLQRGEEVRTREQAAADRENKSVSVVIENKTGTQVGSATATSSFDMGSEVIRIVIDGISRNKQGLRTVVAGAK